MITKHCCIAGFSLFQKTAHQFPGPVTERRGSRARSYGRGFHWHTSNVEPDASRYLMGGAAMTPDKMPRA